MSKLVILSVMILLASQAQAQTNGTYLIKSSNVVSPNTPSTTIEIWAEWTGSNYFFGGGNYDLTASEELFSDPMSVLAPGLGTPGVIGPGNTVKGAALSQLAHPSLPFIGDNPMLIATYTWSTTDFTPRQIELHTSNTSIFVVVNTSSFNRVELYPNEFTPGSGFINVVPAPAAWFALALPVVSTHRRRRCPS